MKEVFIVDYGAGNLGSLQNMLIRKCDVDCTIVTDPLLLPEKGDVTPPGVGHFGFAAQSLADSGWVIKLREFADNGRKLLGICLGAQLLFESSEEGEGEGIAIIPGKVRRFAAASIENGERIPHMGWSNVTVTDKNLEDMLIEDSRFYFVHSYYMQPDFEGHVLMRTDFGGGFCSAVRNKTVTGVQFHPEKSHQFGISFLKAWLTGL